VEVSYEADEMRPVIVLDDVNDIRIDALKVRRSPGVPFFVLRNVRDFVARNCPSLPDTSLQHADTQSL
jgi:hypothetical protein